MTTTSTLRLWRRSGIGRLARLGIVVSWLCTPLGSTAATERVAHQPSAVQRHTETACASPDLDACAEALNGWASFSPDSPALALALQANEAAFALDAPLPPLLRTGIEYYQYQLEDAAARFAVAYRRAAVLRAKLLSSLNAPAHWRDDALATTLRQLSALYRDSFGTDYAYRFNEYRIEAQPSTRDPWRIIDRQQAHAERLKAAVVSEVQRLTAAHDCTTVERWVRAIDAPTYAGIVLHQLIDDHNLCGVTADRRLFDRINKADKDTQHSIQPQLLRSIEALSVKRREELLAGLTTRYEPGKERPEEAGSWCFPSNTDAVGEWLKAVCARWISEPQTVGQRLAHANLQLEAERQFHPTPLAPPAHYDDPAYAAKQHAWLLGLFSTAAGKADDVLHAWVRQQPPEHRFHITYWQHPRMAETVFHVRREGSTDDDTTIIASPRGSSIIVLPERFKFRYGYDLVHVSDLDGDGNPELWWGRNYLRCDGTESDLARDINCRAPTAQMGEVQDGVLTYFLRSEAARKTEPAAKPADLRRFATGSAENQWQDCNRLLLGPILAAPLGIDFGKPDKYQNRGDIISIACKRHPTRPEQLIVALFHELSGKPEWEEDQVGLVVALVDLNGKRPTHVFRGTQDVDASIRIDSHSLQIDTAPYLLAPGVRAIGVRAHIGYSPRCAEGGESDYLSLIVEENGSLRRVLDSIPMSSWELTAGDACGGGDAAISITDESRTLSIAPTASEGWYDLMLTATRSTRTRDPDSTDERIEPGGRHPVGRLRFKQGRYQFDPPLPLP